MSEDRAKLLERIKERLPHLDAKGPDGHRHWKAFHMHKALTALDDDHPTAHLHLNEFDREDWEAAAEEYPELKADIPPSPEDIRSRFTAVAGGTI
jgi:hypothetical protein